MLSTLPTTGLFLSKTHVIKTIVIPTIWTHLPTDTLLILANPICNTSHVATPIFAVINVAAPDANINIPHTNTITLMV